MLEKGFVYLDEYVPGVKWDAKYAGRDNFMGRPVCGYNANRVVIAEAAARAVLAAQARFLQDGLCVFAFDAYRPQRAVDDFVRFVASPEPGTRKAVHFPNVEKRALIDLGYIAAKSGHSRGCTIDLTLANAETGELLDMGGIFDLMDERSHTLSPLVSGAQRENRLYLRRVMLASGFTDYDREWWHFRLKNETYPNTYFDFPIE